MTVQKIFEALQDVKGGQLANSEAAKAGFLEWALTLPKGVSARDEGRRALRAFEDTPIEANAVKLFIAHLRVASHSLPIPKRRGGAGGRRRILH